jgi:hypothetical protein
MKAGVAHPEVRHLRTLGPYPTVPASRSDAIFASS